MKRLPLLLSILFSVMISATALAHELKTATLRLDELSADQVQLKASILQVLDAVRDESGRQDAVRLVFEPKSKNQDQNEFMLMLLAFTTVSAVLGQSTVRGLTRESLTSSSCRWARWKSVTTLLSIM